jgi:hypothetical protein
MNNIEDYLKRTENAVKPLFEAYNSYWKLLSMPERPVFIYDIGTDSDKNEVYENWYNTNKLLIEERLKKDNEYAYEFLARATLCGGILEFAYMGIKMFSTNSVIPYEFNSVIKPYSVASKFCIGRKYNDVPIGLIIFAGRNQAAHYDEKKLREPNSTIFEKMAIWYSSKFKKWYTNSYLDLNNSDIIHYSENITYYLEWRNYESYQLDMLNMLTNSNAI